MHFSATTITLGMLLLSLLLAGLFTDKPPASVDTPARVVVISSQQRTHILYGDARGGGHYHAADKPCKSEFPQDWNKDKIIDTIELIAANDNIPWRTADNSYHTGEQTVDGLRVRVVLSADKKRVITGYPVNVRRNPCPANDH